MYSLLKKVIILLISINFVSCAEKEKSDEMLMKEWDAACGEFELIERRDLFGDKEDVGDYMYHEVNGKNDTCIFNKDVWRDNDGVVYRSAIKKVKTFAEIKKERIDVTKGFVVVPEHGGYYETIMRYNPEREEMSIIGGTYKMLVSSANKKSFRSASNENVIRIYKKVKKGTGLIKPEELTGK